MDFEFLTMTQEDGVATITLNRPDAANAFHLELCQEIYQAALACDTSSVRAVVMTGAGRFFCAGGDMASFQAAEDPAALVKEMTLYLHGAVSRFARMSAPVIMAVNGTAAGGGLSLAMAGDLVLAADTAKFTFAYTKGGLTPDGSSTYFVPRILGLRRTAELMLTNRVLTADEAVAWGLINRVLPGDSLMIEAMELANQLAAGPTAAHARIKTMLHATFSEGLETQMESEALNIAASIQGSDGQEGIAAFREKRPPNFTGS